MIDKLDSLDTGEEVLEGKAAWKYAEDILQLVSRTFALNIQVLRGKLHRSILLAYLYLRIADTVEDDPDMKASEKEVVLGLFADIFRTPELKDNAVAAFENALPESWRKSEHPYMNLCLHSHVVVPLLRELPEMYAAPVRAVTVEMCGGMAKFALRQEAALSAGWFTLEKVSDLDEYCYYVAGIVGKLLTNLFAADTCFISDARKAEMQKFDVSFGLALQVTNIVKDCVEDSGRRVCFIPEEICRRHGFEHSSDLFKDGVDSQKCGAVLSELVEKAWRHLDDAIAYTKLIPNIKMRTRLFCLWPLFMAAENLHLIGNGVSVFTSEKKVKITRDTVKRIVKETSMHFYSDKWIDKAYGKLRMKN
ncbi:MAG: squalene/phytoene synthase family protein [Fibrobacter sp.]|jgi:Phytoene/squalene synthetase|uniref:squalene/phytoene synthase family protein n=1 Tax=Fibrobacter sp. TaxID=35828 RepID=UPI0025BC5454|nr:squalene/phytoene synthase family protein [Fibrobacter sp.]MBQ7080679.1 squalene/phytoene synthase family protein [Fibrobacter sp.]